MIGQFFDEYWMFVEALLAHASDLLGVSVVNQLAASFGLPHDVAMRSLELFGRHVMPHFTATRGATR